MNYSYDTTRAAERTTGHVPFIFIWISVCGWSGTFSKKSIVLLKKKLFYCFQFIFSFKTKKQIYVAIENKSSFNYQYIWVVVNFYGLCESLLSFSLAMSS